MQCDMDLYQAGAANGCLAWLLRKGGIFMSDVEAKILQIIAAELKIPINQVTETIKLLDDGNTVPFIARYRKEVTGGLDEEQIFALQQQAGYQRNLY
ncbi:MAG TPA: hypothetical protein DDY38_00940, partial [Firmicutes bacterium]|nr:hypothetical protein [Bacillota bacterium]